MSLLCSFLIPSRGRFDPLMRAIKSLHDTAKTKDFDVRVKFDECDRASTLRAYQLKDFGNVHVMVAPRLKGYGSIDAFCTVMANESPAKWICIFNDDAVLKGEFWDEKLRDVPTEGFIVQPEIYQLNKSKYERRDNGAFPFVPNGCWKSRGYDIIPSPSDTHFDRMLREFGGWKTHFLEGITVHHIRDQTVPE